MLTRTLPQFHPQAPYRGRVLLLVTGGLTAALSLISDIAVIIVLGLMGFTGMVSALRLKEVTED